jgi:hypothetical protein
MESKCLTKAIIKSKDNFVVTAKVREKSKQMFEEIVESCPGILNRNKFEVLTSHVESPDPPCNLNPTNNSF